MLVTHYEIWAVAIAALLIGSWIINGFLRRQRAARRCASPHEGLDALGRQHDIEHRALMFLMDQKTDSVLAALAKTIQKERQKLGTDVRKPSMNEAIDAIQVEMPPVFDPERSAYDQVLPLAHNGLSVAAIARQLQLPEAEVGMVIRVNAP